MQPVKSNALSELAMKEIAPPCGAEHEVNVTDVRDGYLSLEDSWRTAPLPVFRVMEVNEAELKVIVAEGPAIRGAF